MLNPNVGSIFTEEFRVSTMLVNPNRRLSLVGLLGMLQEAAGLHAEELGFGHEEMMKSQFFWVLIRQKLVMRRWPLWQEKVKIITWPRPLKSMSAIRDFEIYVSDELCGECSTEWMLMDGKNRRPARADLTQRNLKGREDYALSFAPARISSEPTAKRVKIIEVRNSDLDMNNHVNNTKYSQWILDAIPIKLHQEMELSEFEINFVAETYLSDIIEIQRHPYIEENDQRVALYQGFRERDKKIVFVAKLKAKKSSLWA